jgi:hypothetical protein
MQHHALAALSRSGISFTRQAQSSNIRHLILFLSHGALTLKRSGFYGAAARSARMAARDPIVGPY